MAPSDLLCAPVERPVTIGRMAYASLADFLEDLVSAGQLARVEAEVDPELEIAEITRRVAAAGGPALLFEHVRGSSMAVVANLLGTEGRVAMALSIESLDELLVRTESLIEQHTPRNWFDRLRAKDDESGAERFRPKTVKSGACQQVVRLGRDIDLAALPLVKQWINESGAALTAGRIVSQDRAGQHRAVTVSPLLALDANRLAVADHDKSRLSRHWAEHRAAGEKMPIAVVLGGDPAGLVSASLDLPDDVDPFHMAALVRAQALEMVKCRTHAMEVPTDAEIVFEGYLDPESPAARVTVAGAGGSHYRVIDGAAVIHLTAVTHRTHAILPAVVEGGQQGEAAVLAKVRQRMLLPAVRAVAPEVVNLHLPNLGGSDRFAFVAIRKSHPFQARQVTSALWGSPTLRFTKCLVVVDAEVEVCDTARVLAEIGVNVSAAQDVFSYDGPADPAVPGEPALTRHVGIDATTKLPGERTSHAHERIAAGDEIVQLVSSRWAEYKLEVENQLARC